MSCSPADRSSPRFPSPALRGVRLYVVFGYRVAFGERGPIAGLGTVRASNLAAARELGDALARGRGFGASPMYAVRTWRASACRPAWLWEALARDGAACPVRARDPRAP